MANLGDVISGFSVPEDNIYKRLVEGNKDKGKTIIIEE